MSTLFQSVARVVTGTKYHNNNNSNNNSNNNNTKKRDSIIDNNSALTLGSPLARPINVRSITAGSNTNQQQPSPIDSINNSNNNNNTNINNNNSNNSTITGSKEYYTSERFINQRDLITHQYNSKWSRSSNINRLNNNNTNTVSKTTAAALILCLNIGVDPPDIDRPIEIIENINNTSNNTNNNPTNNIQAPLYSRLECWIDPNNNNNTNNNSSNNGNNNNNNKSSLEQIGSALQSQYESLQPRCKFKQCLDPTNSDIKKLCLSLRKLVSGGGNSSSSSSNKSGDRILFHYNGHGVPKPTINGELWLFNRSYTQYIPSSIYDIQSWLNNSNNNQSVIYILDCSAAAVIVEAAEHFKKQAEYQLLQSQFYNNTGSNNNNNNQIDPVLAAHTAAMLAARDRNQANNSESFNAIPNNNQNNNNSSNNTNTAINTANTNNNLTPSFINCIFLAACGKNESLPLNNPDLPADLFTCCLTTPIKIALRYYLLQQQNTNNTRNSNKLINLTITDLELLPGKLSDRKTVLGELNWIYTAITDSIAWSILPSSQFYLLYRSDLLVSSLFRNFLLAQRILSNYGCNPVSIPTINHMNTIKHYLWDCWDTVIEFYCLQLEKYIKSNNNPNNNNNNNSNNNNNNNNNSNNKFTFTSHTFFADQLQSFELWLELNNNTSDESIPPIQLPILLQILLSQQLRKRALILLAKFLSKGNWAINSALSVGILPYIVKLLQSPIIELREVLIFIWTKIMSFDSVNSRIELIKDNISIEYFLVHLAAISNNNENNNNTNNNKISDRQRVMSAFIISQLLINYNDAQSAIINIHNTNPTNPSKSLFNIINNNLIDSDSPMLRRWMCFCLGHLVNNNSDSKLIAISPLFQLQNKLLLLINDPIPEVRAAAIYSISCFITNNNNSNSIIISNNDLLLLIRSFSTVLVFDASPLVREELIIMLYQVIENQLEEFIDIITNNNNANTSTINTDLLLQQQAPALLQRAVSEPQHIILPNNNSNNNNNNNPILIDQSIQLQHSVSQFNSPSPSPQPQPSPAPVAPLSMNTNKLIMNRIASNQSLNTMQSPSAASAANIMNRIDPNNPQSIRLLLWRIIRTLCHDPFPAVNRAAIAVRKYLINRSNINNNYNYNLVPQSPKPVSSISVMDQLKDLGLIDSAATASATELNPLNSPKLPSNNNNNNTYRTDLKEFEIGNGRQRSTAAVDSSNNNNNISGHMRRTSSYSGLSNVSTNNSNSNSGLSHVTSSNNLAGSILDSDSNNNSNSMNNNNSNIPKSTIYDRSCDYFNAPMIDPLFDSEESLQSLLLREYRFKRNTNQYQYTSNNINTNIYDINLNGQFDQIATINSGFDSPVNNLLFHSYESILIGSDSKRTVSIWDYKDNYNKLLTFSNQNSSGSRITAIQLINENTYNNNSLLLIGSDDGIVRVWRNTINNNQFNPPECITSWISIRNMIPNSYTNNSNNPSNRGLILDWQHYTGHLLCSGGNSDLIRIWDIEREICILDLASSDNNNSNNSNSSYISNNSTLPYSATIVNDYSNNNNLLNSSQSYSNNNILYNNPIQTPVITSLTSSIDGSLLYSGYSDGTIKGFDLRTDPNNINCININRHSAACINIQLQRGGLDQGKLISAGYAGDIYLTDLRYFNQLSTVINNSNNNSNNNLNPAIHSLNGFDTNNNSKSSTITLDSFSSHHYNPILSCGSKKQLIRIIDCFGTQISELKYHKGFMGHRIGPITTLNFHPQKLLLAAGGQNQYISILAAATPNNNN